MNYQEMSIFLGNAKFRFIVDVNAEKPVRSPAHAHAQFELFYVESGEVCIQTEKEQYQIGAGQALLIAPAQYHQTITQGCARKINLHFSVASHGKQAGEEDIFGVLMGILSQVCILKIQHADALGGYMLQFCKLLQGDCFAWQERRRFTLEGLVFALHDALAGQVPSDARRQRAHETKLHYSYEIDQLLNANCTRDMRLEDVAQALCLSPKRAAELVKALYGKSFRSVRAEMRIQLAKQMLKETECTVSQIAEKVGFRSTRGFLTAFLQAVGTTPGEYRKQNGAQKTETC